MQNIYGRCPKCMQEIPPYNNPCPHCGFDIDGFEYESECLAPFTVLQGKYMLGKVLGIGGFGITYLGWDLNLATYVAIKEFFPDNIAFRDTSVDVSAMEVNVPSDKLQVYEKGLARYVEEARNLSKFYGLKGIVSVKDFFYANKTAYIVMEYISGINLKSYMANSGGVLDEQTVLSLMKPVFESMCVIHDAGLIHRDISPDNIMFDEEGNIKLIDFGATRDQSFGDSKTYTVMLKHGYAPQEQYYTKGRQGPWTDIYSLCATMYKMMTGRVPPNCIERMSNDTYAPPSIYGVTVSPTTEAVLAKGLQVNIENRYQNIKDLMADLYPEQTGDIYQYGAPIDAPVEEKSKKKWPIILGSVAVAILAVVLVLKLTIFKEDGKPKDIDNGTTDTQTASETTDTTEQLTNQTTEEPILLEGDWTEYCFMIGDDLYQLPMTYDEWISHGWQTDAENYLIGSGEIRSCRFYSDNMECAAYVANYNKEATHIQDCYVIGFSYDPYNFECTLDDVITFPGGVTIDLKGKAQSTTVEGVIEIYGEATNSVIGEYVSACEYYASDNSYVCFTSAEETLINEVYILVLEKPQGAAISASDTPPEILDICAENYNPDNTTDRFDEIFKIDGVNYKLPISASEFIKNGWELSASDERVCANEQVSATLVKGDASIYVSIGNPTIYNLDISQAVIISMEFDETLCGSIDVVFPGGLALGDDCMVAETLYADINDTYESAYYGSAIDSLYEIRVDYPIYDGVISIDIDAYTNEGEDVYRITSYIYSRSWSTSKSDPSNTDYIQGIMVQ